MQKKIELVVWGMRGSEGKKDFIKSPTINISDNEYKQATKEVRFLGLDIRTEFYSVEMISNYKVFTKYRKLSERENYVAFVLFVPKNINIKPNGKDVLDLLMQEFAKKYISDTHTIKAEIHPDFFLNYINDSINTNDTVENDHLIQSWKSPVSVRSERGVYAYDNDEELLRLFENPFFNQIKDYERILLIRKDIFQKFSNSFTQLNRIDFIERNIIIKIALAEDYLVTINGKNYSFYSNGITLKEHEPLIIKVQNLLSGELNTLTTKVGDWKTIEETTWVEAVQIQDVNQVIIRLKEQQRPTTYSKTYSVIIPKPSIDVLTWNSWKGPIIETSSKTNALIVTDFKTPPFKNISPNMAFYAAQAREEYVYFAKYKFVAANKYWLIILGVPKGLKIESGEKQTLDDLLDKIENDDDFNIDSFLGQLRTQPLYKIAFANRGSDTFYYTNENDVFENTSTQKSFWIPQQYQETFTPKYKIIIRYPESKSILVEANGQLSQEITLEEKDTLAITIFDRKKRKYLLNDKGNGFLVEKILRDKQLPYAKNVIVNQFDNSITIIIKDEYFATNTWKKSLFVIPVILLALPIVYYYDCCFNKKAESGSTTADATKSGPVAPTTAPIDTFTIVIDNSTSKKVQVNDSIKIKKKDKGTLKLTKNDSLSIKYIGRDEFIFREAVSKVIKSDSKSFNSNTRVTIDVITSKKTDIHLEKIDEKSKPKKSENKSKESIKTELVKPESKPAIDPQVDADVEKLLDIDYDKKKSSITAYTYFKNAASGEETRLARRIQQYRKEGKLTKDQINKIEEKFGKGNLV